MNIADSIKLHARQRPDKAALIYAGRTLTYRELGAGVDWLASQLQAHGIKPGARVGLCLKDHPAHLLLHYAIGSIGAVIVPVDHRWSPKERTAVVSTFAVDLLITDVDDDYDSPVAGLQVAEWPQLAAAATESVDCEHANLLVSMSSGTTGKPKGALVSHRQLYERFVTQWVTLGFNTTDRFALVTPLFFGAGRSFGMAFLAAGATVVLAPPPHKGQALANAIGQPGVTCTFLVPTAMRRLIEARPASTMFGQLRRLLISGEAFFPSEVRPFKEYLSPNLIGYYASSEGGGVSVLQPHDFDDHGGTVGQAAFGVEVEVVDDAEKAVAAGEVGRLRYRGPGVATRTLTESGEPETPDADGWFYPGDLASIDEAGYISLRGRANDVIIRGGVNVYPAEIEQTLIQHKDIAEAAVLGVDDSERGEVIVAFIAGDALPTDGDLHNWLENQLAPYKMPSNYLRLSALPKAASGKTDKKQLRSEWLS